MNGASLKISLPVFTMIDFSRMSLFFGSALFPGTGLLG